MGCRRVGTIRGPNLKMRIENCHGGVDRWHRPLGAGRTGADSNRVTPEYVNDTLAFRSLSLVFAITCIIGMRFRPVRSLGLLANWCILHNHCRFKSFRIIALAL